MGGAFLEQPPQGGRGVRYVSEGISKSNFFSLSI
jgi:hypothetical protein